MNNTPDGGGRYYKVGDKRLTEQEYQAQLAKKPKPGKEPQQQQEPSA